jgi:hypothetical protein
MSGFVRARHANGTYGELRYLFVLNGLCEIVLADVEALCQKGGDASDVILTLMVPRSCDRSVLGVTAA